MADGWLKVHPPWVAEIDARNGSEEHTLHDVVPLLLQLEVMTDDREGMLADIEALRDCLDHICADAHIAWRDPDDPSKSKTLELLRKHKKRPTMVPDLSGGPVQAEPEPMTQGVVDEHAHRRNYTQAKYEATQASLKAWEEVAAFIQGKAAAEFAQYNDELACGLRDLADEIATEGETRMRPKISAALKEAAKCERTHIGAMEQLEETKTENP